MAKSTEAPVHGYYEGVDNHGVFHRIPKRVDPDIDGTRLVADRPILYPLDTIPKELSIIEFDRLLEKSISPKVLSRVDEVIKKAGTLVEQKKADPVAPDHKARWRRGMVLSWIHSRDIETLMQALGHPKDLIGKHDMEEFAKAKHLKGRLASAADWYKNLVLSFDDEEDINVGFFNPHFSGSMFNWGLNKMGTQNAMDAHRLSDHHLGTPEHPLNLVEKAVNFVIHHLPREHFDSWNVPNRTISKLHYRRVSLTRFRCRLLRGTLDESKNS